MSLDLDIRYTDAPLGHEITGVDLAQPLPDAVFAAIQDAYDRYGVVVFRGQDLPPERQIDFSRRFGPLDRYVLDRYNLASHPEVFVVSNIIEDGQPIGLGDAGQYWHTDMWVKQVPSRGSMLYALEVPHDARGEPLGDTCFASTSAAYDALPEALRQRIEGRKAVFSAQQYIEFRIAQTPVDPATGEVPPEVREGMRERARNMVPEISHPLVKRHPRTGRHCIYFSEGAIHHIEGLGVEESQQILRELQAHLLQPRFVYRHRWRAGDVVMWDNIACLHKAVSDYQWPQRRRMHRTTLAHNPKPEFA